MNFIWSSLRHPSQRKIVRFRGNSRLYHELSFSKYGPPGDVLEYRQLEDIPAARRPAGQQQHQQQQQQLVQIDFIYAPMHPAHLNTIEGKYPDPSTLKVPKWNDCFETRCIGGGEGVARVSAMHGENSAQVVDIFNRPIEIGDFVIMAQPGFGTWRSYANVIANEHVIKLPQHAFPRTNSKIDDGETNSLLASAALISTNPCTAYRIINDFVDLEPGDVVIQNGGASSVGICVSQLLRERGVDTVSIVRRGQRTVNHFERLKDYVLNVGKATLVISEEELCSRKGGGSSLLKNELSKLDNGGGSALFALPKLALNCVGGGSALALSKCIAYGGTMVTYGGMSKKPVTIPTGLLIFSDIRLRGYWQSRYVVEHQANECRMKMVDEIIEYIVSGNLNIGYTEEFRLGDYRDALNYNSNTNDGDGLPRKVLLRCTED